MSAALAALPASTGVADVLSPSQVSTWRDCQARWYFKYLIGLPDTGSPSLALGRAVHAAMGATWRHKLEHGWDLSLEDVLTVYLQRWTEEAAKVEFTEKEDRAEMERRGALLLDRYMREVEPTIHPAAVDLRIEGAIAGVRIQGYIDLVDASGCIIDLKTTKRTPTKIKPNYGFQIATYAQTCRDVEVSGHARLDTLVLLKEPKIVQLSHEMTLPDYHFLRSSYPLVQEQMRTGLYSPNRESFLCSRGKCAYWRQCETEFGGTVPGGSEDE